jgi:hypothetical protein
MKDLSGIHQLVSDMFSWPTTEAEWDKYRLSDEQETVPVIAKGQKMGGQFFPLLSKKN